MRSVLEDEEEELAPLDRPSNYVQGDREVTLSSTTLLAIFFGLTLICALFFAFGYTLGRRTTSETNPQAAAKGASDSATLELASSPAKPSAAAQSNAVPATTVDDSALTDAATGAAASPSHQATQDSSASAETGTVSPSPVVSAPHPVFAASPVAPPQPAETATPGVMVQIAAVSNPADADVLVSALHKRGYSVAVRHEPGDSLMHVQVGPFSTRADAAAMRQKLLADGYNAILK